ncbi:MAG: putative membrane protein [Pseudohongiellaceae bacterium]|jgi:uncharacterized membrane protein|nr:DUF599 domain-containing protein [Pseudomonadota bacterium]MDA1289857.1 DUF599 domain-containing protein [Pseudomonadota bacterium]
MLQFNISVSKLRAMDIYPLDIFSFFWFLSCWLGYSLFARNQAKRRNSLSSVLYRYRKEWVLKLSKSGMSEVDSDLLGSLERQVSFMASTSLLILASLVTVLSAASEDFMDMSSLQFVDEVSLEIVQMKLLLMIFIFVYGFFTFSWALRQYGFCFILFGSSFNTVRYYKGKEKYQAQAVPRDFKAVAKVLDRAAHSYNYGIRAYYFAMAALAWFINDWFFMAACAVVIFVLYRREFKSSSLQAMVDARQVGNVHDEDEIKFD